MPNNRELQEALDKVIESNQQHEKNTTLQREALMRANRQEGRREAQDARANIQWQKLDELLKQMKAEWNRGYNNDWISSVYSIMALSEELGKSIAASEPISKVLHQINLFGGKLAHLKDNNIPENTKFTSLVERVVEEYRYVYPPKTVFPNLTAYAQFTDDKLDLDSLKDMKSTKGKPMMAHLPVTLQNELKDALKLAVIDWMDERGYKVGAEDCIFLDKETDARLTKTDFDALRDDPDTGLSAHLKEKLDAQIDPALAPRP